VKKAERRPEGPSGGVAGQSALDALTSYLDLIIPEEDTRVREQLLRMHVEIDHADQILRDGMRTLGAYLSVPVLR